MTATNHTLTGAILVAVVPNPVVGLVMAFLSHFVLDALPHFGRTNWGHNDKRFYAILTFDCMLAACVLLTIVIFQPDNWLLLVTGGIAGASPDLMWLPHFIREVHRQPKKSLTIIEKFHSKIQWGERPWGWTLEILYTFGAGMVLLSQIR